MSVFDTQPGVTPSDITPLLDFQNINSRDAFGAGETNNGGIPEQLPVYLTVTTDGTPTNFCSVESAFTNRTGRVQNKHGNRRFLIFEVTTSDTFRFEMTNTSSTGAGSPRPQFLIFEHGEFVTGFSNTGNLISVDISLDPGIYAIEAMDLRNDRDGSGANACFNFTIQ